MTPPPPAPEILYGPSLDEEEAALRAYQAKARLSQNPYNGPDALPPLVRVMDPRYAMAFAETLRARTEVLPVGDPRRSREGLSYGEHAALLTIAPRLEALEIPPHLWGTPVGEGVRRVFERMVPVVWREFLTHDLGLSSLVYEEKRREPLSGSSPDDRPYRYRIDATAGWQKIYDRALTKVVPRPADSVLMGVVSKDRMVAEKSSNGTTQEILAFSADIRTRFALAVDTVTTDVFRFEQLQGPREYPEGFRERLAKLEFERAKAESGVSRAPFVQFVQAVLSALGHPMEVGILSVAQSLLHQASSLLHTPLGNQPPRLFLPMSQYGDPCRLMTVNEIFDLLARSLTRYFLQTIPHSVGNLDNRSGVYEDFLLELNQLEISMNDANQITVRNPMRERATRLMDAFKQFPPVPEGVEEKTIDADTVVSLLSELSSLTPTEIHSTYAHLPRDLRYRCNLPRGYIGFWGFPTAHHLSRGPLFARLIGTQPPDDLMTGGAQPLSAFLASRQNAPATTESPALEVVAA